MVFKRKILNDLLAWKNSPFRKPLIIRGARQVGKTTVIKEFGKSFDTFYMLNLEIPAHHEYFSKNLSPHEILQKISLDTGIRRNGNTLLFLDEIQQSSEAIAMLRYFFEDIPELYVVAAGSLLEVMMDRKQISFPVGRVEYLYLYPLNFHEYLEALEEEEALKLLHTIPLPAWGEDKLASLFKAYTLIGGMPEAVNRYILKKEIESVNEVYRNLFTSYTDDAAKYAKNETEKNVLRFVIEGSPAETGKRITFEKFAHSNYRSREVGNALRTLQRAMILFLRYPVTSIELPITPDYRKKPRLEFIDTGMLNYITGIQSSYFDSITLDSLYKGMIAEQITAQELLSSTTKELSLPLFWVREENNANAEVDFIIQHKNIIIPVEVKSGKTGTLRSLHSLIDRTSCKIAVRLYSGSFTVEQTATPNGKEYILIHLPLFLSSKIKDYVGFVLQTK